MLCCSPASVDARSIFQKFSLALAASALLAVFGSARAADAQAAQTFPLSGTSPSITISGTDSSAHSSAITVSNPNGTEVSSVSLRLNGVTSEGTNAAGTEGYSLETAVFWLQSPSGQKFVLLGATGDGYDGNDVQGSSGNGLSNATITISDGASASAPGTNNSTQFWEPQSGTFTVKPTSYASAVFGSAPLSGVLYPSTDGSATLASAFGNSGAEGTWTLWAQTFVATTPVQVSNWTLTLNYVQNPTTVATTTSVSSSLNPANAAGTVTFTASVTASGTPVNGGTIAFTSTPNGGAPTTTLCNAVPVSNGIAACSTTAGNLGQGISTVTAAYTPASGFVASQGSTNQLVEEAAVNTSGDTWCNNTSFTVPNNGTGQVYPSIIKVTGYAAGQTVSTAVVHLNGISGSGGIGGQYLLVAPGGGGQNLDFMDRAFGPVNQSAVDLIFMDDGGQVPNAGGAATSGSYNPYDGEPAGSQDFFPASGAPSIDPAVPQVPSTIAYPAPFGSSSETFFSNFNGAPANGDWALYVTNINSAGPATLANGWCIDLTPNTGVGTATAVTSSKNPAAPGDSVTLTGTVTSAGVPVTEGGTVTFLDNSLTPGGTASGNNVVSLNATGSAAFTTSGLASQVPVGTGTQAVYEGDHTISANYSGTSDYNPSLGMLLERIDNPTTVTYLGSNQYSACNGTVSNPGPIYSSKGLAGAFTPNPSNVFVKNMPGTVSAAGVTLNNLSATTDVLNQVESMVAGPTGAALDFFSGADSGNNGTDPVTQGNYVFTDSAETAVPEGGALTPGQYKPSSYLSNDTFFSSACTSATCLSNLTGFKAPSSFNYSAPVGSSTFASTFGNTNPNGTWSLFFHVKGTLDAVSIPNGWCLNLTENPVPTAVDVSHQGAGVGGNFEAGQSGAAITVRITNEATTGSTGDPTGSNPLTVQIALGASGAPIAQSAPDLSSPGTDWSCTSNWSTSTESSTVITCKNSDPIMPGQEYPLLSTKFSVSNNPGSTITPMVTVSGAGVTTNTASDTIQMDSAPSLTFDNAITNSGNFKQGGTGQWVIPVYNQAGSGQTYGTITLLDTLPTGYTLSSYSSTGNVWTCSGVGTGSVSCTTATSISAGSSSGVTLTVNIPANSPISVTNTVAVYGGGDLIHVDAAHAVTGSNTAGVTQTPATVAVSSGNNQSAEIRTSFALPLVAIVKDANGAVISGTGVTFTIGTGAGGASAIFFDATTSKTVNTDGGGLASTPLTANTTAGSFTVTAQAGAGGPTTTFTLTNLPGIPARVTAASGSGQSVVINNVFAVPLKVLVQDIGNNPISGVSVQFSAPASGASASLSTPNCTTDATGSCSITATANGVAGSYSVQATVDGFAASFSLTNLAIPSYLVTVNTDPVDGTAANCVDQNAGGGDNSNCSLRDALAAAAVAGGNITFHFTTPTTILLDSAITLTIPTKTTITGPTTGSGATLANLVTVDGKGGTTVFTVQDSSAVASLANLIITNGSGMFGGGINNNGTLTVSNSTITGSQASWSGGGIANVSGTLTINGSTIANNHVSTGAGAGIFSAGPLFVNDSTITQNTGTGAGAQGAGLAIAGSTATVTSSTITGNSVAAGDNGGGVVVGDSSTLNMANSIVGGNSAPGGYADIYIVSGSGAYNDLGGNLAGTAAGATSSVNASLALLNNYGGPTQVMIPSPGSPAICAGTVAPSGGLTLPSADQRGLPIHGGGYCASGTVDSGAVQTNYSLKFTQQPPVTVEAGSNFSAGLTVKESGLAISGATLPLTLTGSGSLNPTSPSATTDSNGVASYTMTATNGTQGKLTAMVTPSTSITSVQFLSTNTNPFGHLDVAYDATTKAEVITPGHDLHVGGWATDLVNHVNVTSVTVYIEGKAVGTAQQLGVARPDVGSAMGSAYATSGWIFTYPASSVAKLVDGTHVVTAVATDAGGQSQRLLGSMVINSGPTPNLPFGYLDEAQDATTGSQNVDAANGLHVSGWAADWQDGAPIKGGVTVYIDGTAVGNAVLGNARPDVASVRGGAYLNSGWILNLPASALNTIGYGSHKVTAVAKDGDGNSQQLLGSITYTLVVPPAMVRAPSSVRKAQPHGVVKPQSRPTVQ